ncbi:hypothetical protein GQ600_423 [Phytophthora cactorum]|nr:hypothetical protein GQ600_423 [Phytophthora cactorum]
MDSAGDMIRTMALSGMVQATMAGLKYSYCGQMKRLLKQKHASGREQGAPFTKNVCVTCLKPITSSKLKRLS